MTVVSKFHLHDLTPLLPAIRAVIAEVQAADPFTPDVIQRAFRHHPKPDGGLLNKNLLVRGYRHLVEAGELPHDCALLKRLQMKPTRTISGVAPVTVLTKPYPCPGKCIFCPTDVRMPKSYLHDEPGAMRAEQHQFDPYAQTASRIQTFYENGHNVNKIELLILGGTWSSYRHDYREWFVHRLFDAMNGIDSPTLAEAHHRNETAAHRNVGLVIETRPDHVNPTEIQHLRQLGVTKVQMGAQSLDDRILELNQRGHTVEETRAAVTLLRAAGFKIVLHWMPNLLGATPESDYADYQRLWNDPALRPDELKIYPCSLLANAELYQYWQRGEYTPYDDPTLVQLVSSCMALTPPYTRINRVYRDIPATNIVAGSKLSNLRQVVDTDMTNRALVCNDIRAREVRDHTIDGRTLHLNDYIYATRAGEEHFLSFDTPTGNLAGFCRLSLPTPTAPDTGQPELRDTHGQPAALIREVHVYGPALDIGNSTPGHAQHSGLGTRLLHKAEHVARAAGYGRLAIIAAIGTRQYYASRGYHLAGTYMVKDL